MEIKPDSKEKKNLEAYPDGIGEHGTETSISVWCFLTYLEARETEKSVCHATFPLKVMFMETRL